MKLESKRLFINNLTDNINEADLRKKISNYGTVTSVEIKERKNVVGNQTQHFAYVNLTIEKNELENCIQEFANKKWKGHFLDLQLAKESFIERLKREREENKTQASVCNPVDKTTHRNDCVNNLHVNNRVNINKFNSSSEDEELENSSTKTQMKSINQSNNHTITGNVKEDISNTKKQMDYNPQQDNAKRLQSLAQMKQGYRQQKLLIKNALSNIDTQTQNKIIFDDSLVNTSVVKLSNNDNRTEQHKVSLFDEDDDNDDSYNFDVPEELNGVRAQKLMHLQSKFRNDKRFKMDSRFLDDGEDDAELVKSVDPAEEEKAKQLEILETVIGKELKRPSSTNDLPQNKRPKMMLRFDPSQPEHSQYEVQPVPKENVKQQQKAKKVIVTKTVAESVEPEVSKETFYQVAANLKEALHENKGFSLTKMFNNTIEIEEETLGKRLEDKATIIEKTYNREPNPFKYDSSDDEQEDTTSKKDPVVDVKKKVDKGLPPPKLWSETFFFKEDDYRLQEGFDFIKRLQVGEQQNFQVVRGNLKKIIRAKVKNNLRKNRPFKRKLGGNKKRIKVKKALKH